MKRRKIKPVAPRWVIAWSRDHHGPTGSVRHLGVWAIDPADLVRVGRWQPLCMRASLASVQEWQHVPALVDLTWLPRDTPLYRAAVRSQKMAVCSHCAAIVKGAAEYLTR